MESVVQLMRELPALCFTPPAWLKLQLVADLAPGEVGGFGILEVGEHRMTVQDVLLPTQICSAVSTELDPAGIASLLAELVDDGEDVGLLRLWWHSHSDGTAFMSHKDRKTLSEAFPQADFMVGLVINRKGETFASLYCYRPLALVAEPLEVILSGPDGRDLREDVRAEVARKVLTTAAPVVEAEVASPGSSAWPGCHGSHIIPGGA